MRHAMSRTGAWDTRRFLALLGSIVIWGAIAVDAWYLWPSNLGGATSLVIVSGHSMEPTYYGGDLVIARKMTPSVGDVIIYAPQSLGGSQVVHRIIGGDAENGWELQGDNNDFVDPFTPKGDEVKGVVLLHYSNLGRLTALLLNPIIWAFVLLASIVVLLWFGDDCDDDEADDDADGSPEHVPGSEDAVAAPDIPDIDAGPASATDRRLTPVGRVSAILVTLMVAFGISAAPASAASLSVTAGRSYFMNQLNACGDPSPAWQSTTTSTGSTSTQITISNIPAGCVNQPFTISVRNSSGTQIATASGTPTSATFSFTASSYTVSAVSTVIVTAGGWLFPTTWSTSGSVPAYSCVPVNNGGNVPGGGTCTISNIQISTWSSGGYEWATVQMVVTSSHNDARVTLNLSQAPFPGWTPQSLIGNGDFVVATVPIPAYQCSQLPVLEMNRNTSNGSWTLYFQMTTQPNAFPWASGTQRICP